MISLDQFNACYEAMEVQRTKKHQLSRFGSLDKDGGIIKIENNACYAQVKNLLQSNPYYIWSVWYGDAPEGNPEAGGGRDYPTGRRSEFIPGPHSDKWLKLLLDPEISPWKLIHPFIVNNDFDTIRKSGFIIDVSDRNKLPFNLLYNFLIATRWAYEFSHKFKLFEDLLDRGVDPRIALGMAATFIQDKKVERVLVREAGFRKEKHRYIKDEWGDKRWFPAEYKTTKEFTEPTLKMVYVEMHEPLSDINRSMRRIYSGEPNLKKIGGEAWSIFYSDYLFKEIEWNSLVGKKPEQVVDAFTKALNS